MLILSQVKFVIIIIQPFNYDKENDKINFTGLGGIAGLFKKNATDFEVSDSVTKILTELGNAPENAFGENFEGLKETLNETDFERVTKFMGYVKEHDDDVAISADMYKDWAVNIEKVSDNSSKAKLSLKGLGAALLNGLTSMAIAAGIQLIVAGIDNIVHASEKGKEALEEFNSTIEEAREELKSQSDFINSDEVKEWEKLSKGVDQYGDSIYNSAEEMDKYHTITNKIAEMFPNVVSDWNEQGNAVLKYGTNVELLNKALEENRKQHYYDVYAKGEKTYKGYQKDVGGWTKLGGDIESVSAYKGFIDNGFRGNLNTGVISDLLHEADVKFSIDENDNILVTDSEQQKKVVATYKQVLASVNAETAKIKPVLTSYLEVGDADYQNLSDDVKQKISTIVNSFDYSFFTGRSLDDIFSWISTNLVRQFQKPEVTDAVNGLMELEPNTMSESDFVKSFHELINKLNEAGLSDEVITQIKLAFDIEDVDSEERDKLIAEKINENIDAIKAKFTKEEINVMLSVGFNIENLPDDIKNNLDALKDYVQNYVVFKNSTDALSKSQKNLAANTTKVTNNWNDYKKMSEAVNKTHYLSNKEMSNLVEKFPELKDNLALTQEGWALESGALDLVQKAAIALQQSYINAQTEMTDKGLEEAFARIGINIKELKNIKNINEAYDLLSKRRGSALPTSESGEVDRSALTMDEQAALGYVDNSIISNQVEEMLQKINSLGKDVRDGKSQKDIEKEIKNIQEQLNDLDESDALETVKHKFDEIEQSIQKVDDALSLLDTTLGLQAENDYVGKLETITRQIDLTQQKVLLLKDEFAKLSQEEVANADTANELASRMKSVVDSIASGRKSIIDYGKNITEYYMSAMKSIGSLSKNAISQSNSLFERNVKALENGGLTGLQFTLSPIVPQDAVDKQRQENRSLEDEMRSYYETVGHMQKTALDLQYQETLADNEKKRQELIESLTKAKGELEIASQDVLNLQKTTNEKTSQEQKQDHAEKATETQSFSNIVEGIIADISDWMVNNPIKAPGLDTISWDVMVKDAENYAQKVVNAFNRTTSFDSISGNENLKSTFGTGREAMVKLARSMVGYKEGANNDNIFSKYFGNGAQAWCNDFVSWAAKESGLGDVIPLGSSVLVTAGQFKKQNRLWSAGSGYQPKIGDIAYFSKSGKFDDISHVEIVTKIEPDGTIWTIGGNTGAKSDRVEEHKRIPQFFGTFSEGTKGFDVYGENINGVAGENYKKEILINKQTGNMVTIDEPTFIDTNKYDVVGEKTTAKVLPQYATGTPTSNQQLLSIIKNVSQETGVPANVLMSVIDQESGYKWIDKSWDVNGYSYGYMQLHDPNGELTDMLAQGGDIAALARKAMVDPYTNVLVGAQTYKRLYDKYGNWGDAAAAYNMGEGGFAKYGRNSYGNQVLERANSVAFVEAANRLMGSTMQTDVRSIADNVSAISRFDFRSDLENYLSGENASSYESWQKDLLAYIKENVEVDQNSTQVFIDKFNQLQEYQNSQVETFKSYDEQLLQAVGTDGFASLRNQISKLSEGYTTAIMGLSNEITLEQAKTSFEQAQQTQKAMLSYFNKRRGEGANADELNAIISTYNEYSQGVNEISDNYVSRVAEHTEYATKIAERNMQLYADESSWLDKTSQSLEKDYENTSDTAEKSRISKEKIDTYQSKIALLTKKQRDAHQKVLDLYRNDMYKPIFERFDLETWFDASGEATSQYSSDIERMSQTMPELVPIMKEIFSLVQLFKKAWYDADEEIQNAQDNIKEIANQDALELVDTYLKLQDRLKEVLSYQQRLNDATTEAKQQMYSIYKTLRDEQFEIEALIKGNKRLEQWLDPETRRLLFNEDDYKAEMAEMADIRAEATKLYKNYQHQISNLTEEDSWKEASITAEYNKQVEALNERLEVAKQTLDVAKKQAAYDNAMRERDTQIIMGGRAVNVHDPDDAYNKAQEVAKAELTKANTVATNAENADIRDMQRVSDTLSKEIAAIENRVDMINSMNEEERASMAKFLGTIDEITIALNTLTFANPYYITSTDSTHRLYSGLDPGMISQGYQMTYDYEAQIARVGELVEKGLMSAELGKEYIKWLERDHDYKTTTDTEHSGYPIHNLGAEYLKGNHLMKMYETNPELANSHLEGALALAVREDNGSNFAQQVGDTVVSGNFAQDGSIMSFLPQGYKTINLGDYASMGLAFDFASRGNDVVANAVLAALCGKDSTLNFDGKDDIFTIVKSGSEDNSVHYNIEHLNITNPIGSADELFNSLNQKLSSQYAVTKNMK